MAPERGENFANHAREVVTVARQQVCRCHESVEFGSHVYGMKRYCGGERPGLLLAPVIGIFLVEFSPHHAFAMSTASVTGNSGHGDSDTVQLQSCKPHLRSGIASAHVNDGR